MAQNDNVRHIVWYYHSDVQIYLIFFHFILGEQDMDNNNSHCARSEFHWCLYSDTFLHQYFESFSFDQCRVELWCGLPKELSRTLLPEPDSGPWRNVIKWICSGQCYLWGINSWLFTSWCCGLTTRILPSNVAQKFNSAGFLDKLFCYRQ